MSLLPHKVNLADASGTTAAGVAEDATTQTFRNYLLIQNPSASSASLWVNFVVTAVGSQPSIEIQPGVTWEPPVAPQGKVSVFSTAAIDYIVKQA